MFAPSVLRSFRSLAEPLICILCDISPQGVMNGLGGLLHFIVGKLYGTRVSPSPMIYPFILGALLAVCAAQDERRFDGKTRSPASPRLYQDE